MTCFIYLFELTDSNVCDQGVQSITCICLKHKFNLLSNAYLEKLSILREKGGRNHWPLQHKLNLKFWGPFNCEIFFGFVYFEYWLPSLVASDLDLIALCESNFYFYPFKAPF